MSIASAIEVLQPEEYCRVLTFLHDTGALDGLQRVSALLADAQALDEEHETDVMLDLIALAHHDPTLAQLIMDRFELLQCTSTRQPRQLQSVLGICIAATSIGQCLYCTTYRCAECDVEVEVPIHSPWHAVHTQECTACGAAMQEAITQRRMLQVQHVWLGPAPGSPATRLQQPLLVTLLGTLCMGARLCVGGVYWVAGQLLPVSHLLGTWKGMLPQGVHGAAWQMMAANIQPAPHAAVHPASPHYALNPPPHSLGTLVDSLQAALMHRAHLTTPLPWHLLTTLLLSAATTSAFIATPLLLLIATPHACMRQRLLAHAAEAMGLHVHVAHPGCPLAASVHHHEKERQGRPCMLVQGGQMAAARHGVLLLDTTAWMGTKAQVTALQQVIDPSPLHTGAADAPSCMRGTTWAIVEPPAKNDDNKLRTVLLATPQTDIVLSMHSMEQSTHTTNTTQLEDDNPWWGMLLEEPTPCVGKEETSLRMHIAAAQRRAGALPLSSDAQQLLQAYFVHVRSQCKGCPNIAATTLFERLVRLATASAHLRHDDTVQPFPDVTIAAWLLETSLTTQAMLQQASAAVAGGGGWSGSGWASGEGSVGGSWGTIDLQQVMDGAADAVFEERLSLLHQELVHMTRVAMAEY